VIVAGATVTRRAGGVGGDQRERRRGPRHQAHHRDEATVGADLGVGAGPRAVGALELEGRRRLGADEATDHVRREIGGDRRVLQPHRAPDRGRGRRGAAVEPGGRRVERGALRDQRHRIVALDRSAVAEPRLDLGDRSRTASPSGRRPSPPARADRRARRAAASSRRHTSSERSTSGAHSDSTVDRGEREIDVDRPGRRS
jgi:hypothetical protein